CRLRFYSPITCRLPVWLVGLSATPGSCPVLRTAGLLRIRALRARSVPGRGAEWTSWFNIDHPGGDGDYESLEAIRFYYRGRVCERPVAIQARTTEWELPEDVGEVVHVSPKKGFRCINKEQPQGKTCSNYHIRFLCPLGERPSHVEGGPYPLLARHPPRCRIPPDWVSIVARGTGPSRATLEGFSRRMHGWGGSDPEGGGHGLLHPLPPSSPAEKPYMVLHPKAKVRVAGQEVTFCCKASGTPVPKKYYWYHNGTLLERKVYRYGSHLVLRGLPLRFGQIFLGGRKVGFTGYKGSFTIEVPPDTQRLVVRFVDRQQRLVDAVKVLPFNRRGGAVYQEVKMLRKKEPVDLDGSRSNAIPLGEASGQEPIGELVLPAGVFLRPSGEVFRGTVKASVTFLDPRDMATASAASSDLSFANAEGEIVPLRTYGMFAVDFLEGESGAALQTGPVEVRMDAAQVRMPEHLQKMKLWSLNPETGLWEEEGVLRPAGGNRGKREERTFLVGNLEIRERRLFNLDVPEDRRCFVKVRAYSNEKFNPYEQLEGVVISLINLEPQPGYPANPRAWGRFDSVVTGPNGACLPAFCDGQRPDAYSAYVTATLGGEELEAVASSPKLNPNAVGVSQPYLGKLGYRRLDHDDPNLKKTAFQINVAKPDPNNVDETNGPIYPYRSLEECEEAPVSANHLRFYRVEVDKYEYNVVPFKESDLTSWTGDYLSWWPNPQEFRACFIKVQIEGPQEYMVRSRNVGGSHPRTRGQLYGLRDTRSVRDTLLENTSGACVEFKCSGMLFDQSLVDRTLVSIVPQGSCHRTAVNSLLRDYLSRHPPVADNNHTAAFTMLAPVDPLGHNYGIYTVTDQNPRLAKEIAIGRCFDGTSDGFSREMKADAGTAVTFTSFCPNYLYRRQKKSSKQALLNPPSPGQGTPLNSWGAPGPRKRVRGHGRM
uniref:Cartilage intermediate layer protein 2 n=1 Tax=Buteo japonicus TaxID=224669 RepID=A0A8C0BII7_9AVES